MINLKGKNAIITADRRNWTSVLAKALSDAGVNITVAGSKNSDKSEAVDAVIQSGGNANSIDCDLTDPKDIKNMIEQTISSVGQIHILVNNAHIPFGKPFLEISHEEWDLMFDFNVRSIFLCCQLVGKHMIENKNGRIINMTSGLAERGLVNTVADCANHGAIKQLTAALALEWATQGIRVNAIGAGWMKFEKNSKESTGTQLERFIPSRRMGHPSDLSGLLRYLASDQSDFITGQTIHVDGGALAHA